MAWSASLMVRKEGYGDSSLTVKGPHFRFGSISNPSSAEVSARMLEKLKVS